MQLKEQLKANPKKAAKTKLVSFIILEDNMSGWIAYFFLEEEEENSERIRKEQQSQKLIPEKDISTAEITRLMSEDSKKILYLRKTCGVLVILAGLYNLKFIIYG
jgi:hypothetical protein